MARLEAFERDLRVASIGRLTGEEHRRQFIAVAKRGRDQEIARQTARGGALPDVVTETDGVRGASPDSVKLGGRIRFNFRYWREIAAFALDTAREFSPVESGAYRDSHFLMADGALVDPRSVPPGTTEIIITNDQPYARKIQVGAMEMSVPAGIYDRVRVAVNAKYGALFRTDVVFVDLAGAYQLKKSPGRLKYPALAIKARFG